MKLRLITILLFITTIGFSQFQGPIPAITNGYGSEGTHSVSVTNITNDHFFLKDISVFYPTGTTTPIPTICFLHGYGGNDTLNYIETLRNLASNGYAVVFVPYKTLSVTIPERYLTLYDGFVKAANTLPSLIDTTRVGFFGHSFGGGATPRIAYRLFTENNWGANGKFIYCSAPWYSYELGTTNLSNFPTDCKMLTVLFDRDDVNDHRMGMDIFNSISIADSLKDCITVYADTINGYPYEADHSLPAQYSTNGMYDAHDYYVTFRLLAALADYSFTGNVTAKAVALGNGSSTQTNMGILTPLSVTDNPIPEHEQSIYDNPCDDVRNERQAYCQSLMGNDTYLNERITVYPNPTRGYLKINSELNSEPIVISVLTLTGEPILTRKNQTEIDISHLPNGMYVVVIHMDPNVIVEKIFKLD